VHIVLPS